MDRKEAFLAAYEGSLVERDLVRPQQVGHFVGWVRRFLQHARESGTRAERATEQYVACNVVFERKDRAAKTPEAEVLTEARRHGGLNREGPSTRASVCEARYGASAMDAMVRGRDGRGASCRRQRAGLPTLREAGFVRAGTRAAAASSSRRLDLALRAAHVRRTSAGKGLQVTP